jgi:hypothetical protein
MIFNRIPGTTVSFQGSTTRDLHHWMSIPWDELGREIDDFRETTNFVLAPITDDGFGTPVTALAVIGAIGSGGVLLVALGARVDQRLRADRGARPTVIETSRPASPPPETTVSDARSIAGLTCG